MNAPLWQPDAKQRDATQWADFTRWLAHRGLIADASMGSHALWTWSVSQPEQFWESLWQYCDILADHNASGRQHDAVLVGGHRMAPPDAALGPHWFPGARLNFAEHMLRRRDEHTAIVSWTEQGQRCTLSYRQLAEQVARCASALRAVGVVAGDRVAGWLPNVPEAVIAMLAAASIGAIWSSCSPDFGVDGVLDRFGQIEPTVLVVSDCYQYAGKTIDVLARVAQVNRQLPSLRATWVVKGADVPADIAAVDNAAHWHDVLAVHTNADLTFTRLPFDHPLYILYSSGTTGLPKCIVHGAGGTLLQHLKEHVLHTDLRATDTMFYFTTCGWMMWNWLVSSLAVGATIVLYDGAPLPANDPSVLWRMAAQEGVSVFGTSAKYLSALEKAGVRPREREDLSRLRCVLSTGSPLAEPSYDFVYRDISPHVQLASISGGTDIVSCFALGDPTGPVHRGELQIRGLGMAVDIWSERGEPVRGEAGELVCTAPFPSMPVAFWNDANGAKYRAAYFEHFPGVWRHGDWAEITRNDGLIIHGRSDATLNPGGVRIGTAEIYRQVESLPEILESVVTEHTVTDRSGTEARVALFVRLSPGVALDAELAARIRGCIRAGASPHHVPRVIGAVPDIPRTRSGKISELAVREVIHGRPVKNADALANPESLAAFAGHPALAE